MSVIDCMSGTYEEWCEFHQWVARSKRPQYCRYFYPTPQYGENKDGTSFTGRMTNTPTKVDRWLWKNCPLKFVKRELKWMYGKNAGKYLNSTDR